MQSRESSEGPDWAKMERPHSTDTEKMQLAGRIISSDKDNWVKSVIPQGFVMSVATLLSLWPLIEAPPPYVCPLGSACQGGKPKNYTDPEAFITHVWEEYYHIHQMAMEGRARGDFVDIASAPFSLGMMEKNDKSRMQEGARK